MGCLFESIESSTAVQRHFRSFIVDLDYFISMRALAAVTFLLPLGILFQPVGLVIHRPSNSHVFQKFLPENFALPACFQHILELSLAVEVLFENKFLNELPGLSS